jgi:response regulator NasT
MNGLRHPLRIALADDERDTREFFQELLPRLGYEVVTVAETGRQLADACRTCQPDLVITDIRMPDMDGIEAADVINRERSLPVILVSAFHDADYLARAEKDHIMAYLVKPVKPADLVAAVSLAMMRFEHFQKLRQEAASLRQALEDRKVIERAKGVVIRRGGLEEPEAFRRLQKVASDHNYKLVEIAHAILTAEEVYQMPPRAG